MKMLLKSLTRNETTLATNEKLVSDIEDYTSEEQYRITRNMVADYLNVLNNIHLLQNQLPFFKKIRSSVRVGKTVKRHFVDPSLACSVLGLKQEQLINDLELFGFMFESLELEICEYILNI